jgi:hypothetical protein
VHAGIGRGRVPQGPRLHRRPPPPDVPTSGCFVEDALVEFHALQHAGRDFASEAQQAQAANAWPTAVALWRQVAEASGDAAERERCLKQAAWCDDMAALVEEPADQP